MPRYNEEPNKSCKGVLNRHYVFWASEERNYILYFRNQLSIIYFCEGGKSKLHFIDISDSGNSVSAEMSSHNEWRIFSKVVEKQYAGLQISCTPSAF